MSGLNRAKENDDLSTNGLSLAYFHPPGCTTVHEHYEGGGFVKWVLCAISGNGSFASG
jgi:hypothetical protein